MHHSLTTAITFASTILGGVVVHLVPSDFRRRASAHRASPWADLEGQVINLRAVILKKVRLDTASWDLLNATLEEVENRPPTSSSR